MSFLPNRICARLGTAGCRHPRILRTLQACCSSVGFRSPKPIHTILQHGVSRQLFDREGGSFSAAAGSGSDSDDSREPELISWIRKAAQIDDDDDDYPDLR